VSFQYICKLLLQELHLESFNLIRFSVDQPISIISFGFYGPFTAETADYEIHVKLTKDSSDLLLAEVPTTIVAAKRKEVFHVKFTKAVPVLPGNTYRAWFSLKVNFVVSNDQIEWEYNHKFLFVGSFDLPRICSYIFSRGNCSSQFRQI